MIQGLYNNKKIYCKHRFALKNSSTYIFIDVLNAEIVCSDSSTVPVGQCMLNLGYFSYFNNKLFVNYSTYSFINFSSGTNDLSSQFSIYYKDAYIYCTNGLSSDTTISESNISGIFTINNRLFKIPEKRFAFDVSKYNSGVLYLKYTLGKAKTSGTKNPNLRDDTIEWYISRIKQQLENKKNSYEESLNTFFREYETAYNNYKDSFINYLKAYSDYSFLENSLKIKTEREELRDFLKTLEEDDPRYQETYQKIQKLSQDLNTLNNTYYTNLANKKKAIAVPKVTLEFQEKIELIKLSGQLEMLYACLYGLESKEPSLELVFEPGTLEPSILFSKESADISLMYYSVDVGDSFTLQTIIPIGYVTTSFTTDVFNPIRVKCYYKNYFDSYGFMNFSCPQLSSSVYLSQTRGRNDIHVGNIYLPKTQE